MSKKASLTDLLNDLNYKVIYERLKNLALNLFEWEGLPEGMRPEYIERLLFSSGLAVFFKSEHYGFLCLTANQSGGLNPYGEWVKVRPFAASGAAGSFPELEIGSECVLIRNNPLKTPTANFIKVYANKLYEIERSLDTNVKQQKTPYIILCDDKDILTFKNIFRQIDGNEPVIYADKNLRLDAITVLETNAPFVADKLSDYRHDVENEVLTFLGINNANTDKRERLNGDEVNANNEFIVLNAAYMLQAREIACQEINELFGLNLSVKRREVDPDVSTVHNNPGGSGE